MEFDSNSEVSNPSSPAAMINSTDNLEELDALPLEDKQREIHNMVERMRRYRISSCIARIAERIPNLGQDKLDKSNVLETALKYLKFLRSHCANIEIIDEAYLAQYGGGPGRPARPVRGTKRTVQSTTTAPQQSPRRGCRTRRPVAEQTIDSSQQRSPVIPVEGVQPIQNERTCVSCASQTVCQDVPEPSVIIIIN